MLTGDTEQAARDLGRRESGCCSFFAFDFATTQGPVMGIEVPAAYIAVLDAFAARVQNHIGDRR